jgi:hypothetical protein
MACIAHDIWNAVPYLIVAASGAVGYILQSFRTARR